MWFSEGFLAIKIRKIKVKMIKPVYLGLSLVGISKTLVYKFRYNYFQPKYQ